MFMDQKLSVIRMSPILNFRFNTISIKTSADIFEEIDRLILRLIWKWKQSTMAKALTLPDF